MERPFPAYRGGDPYIFVSYAHEDDAVVYPEIQWLKDQGFNIWYDEGITPGHEWREEIADSIDGSDLFLYYITPRSVESPHCKREVNYAMDQGKQLLVVQLEETELRSGLSMSLGSIQAILRHELSELDYRIKLLKTASDHIQRGIGVVSDASSAVIGVTPRRVAWIGLACLLVGGLVSAIALWASRGVDEVIPRQPERFVIDPPEGVAAAAAFSQALALSNDGRRIVFTGARQRGGLELLFLARDLGDVTPVPISGTEVRPTARLGPGNFALSPDGEWIAFIDGDREKIRKVRLSGGQPVTVCSIEGGGFQGMTWGSTGTIVFTNVAYPGLMQVAESGGTPRPLTDEATGREEIHLHPHFLPDGDALLFTRESKSEEDPRRQVVLLVLATGEQRVLAEGHSPQVALSGHLLFYRDEVIWAAPFDLDTLEVTGDAVPVVEGVMAPIGRAHYSVSVDGSLVYRTGTLAPPPGSSLVWVDREGEAVDMGLGPNGFMSPRLSPNGEQIAVVINDPDGDPDLWIYAITRKTLTRLTFDGVSKNYPLWSPDGKYVVYRAGSLDRASGLYRSSADGTGVAERLTRDERTYKPGAWADDGQVLIFGLYVPPYDTWQLRLGDGSAPKPLWVTEFNERFVALSPDGKWLAYQSDESGEPQIYVRPYPNVEGGRWQVSSDLGTLPRWGPSGREIFYLGRTELMVVPIGADPSFMPGTPKALFKWRGYAQWYDVTPDGDRFLMVKPQPSDQKTEAQIILVKNWVDELERLVPTN